MECVKRVDACVEDGQERRTSMVEAAGAAISDRSCLDLGSASLHSEKLASFRLR